MSLLTSVQQPSLSNFYFALAGDASLNNANWASFPAITTINASGNAIDNASSIEIDGFVLTAGPNQLLLDGVPLVTTVDLSSIADWSLYESLSGGVDMNGVLPLGPWTRALNNAVSFHYPYTGCAKNPSALHVQM